MRRVSAVRCLCSSSNSKLAVYAPTNATSARISYNASSTMSTTTTILTPPSRPSYHRRAPSTDSPGWYLSSESTPTLEDFATRSQTLLKRFERFQTRCATDVVMALMRPGTMVLFVLNPVAIMLYIALAVAWAVR